MPASQRQGGKRECHYDDFTDVSSIAVKVSIIDGVLDEDLYQELSIILLKAIKLFKI